MRLLVLAKIVTPISSEILSHVHQLQWNERFVAVRLTVQSTSTSHKYMNISS